MYYWKCCSSFVGNLVSESTELLVVIPTLKNFTPPTYRGKTMNQLPDYKKKDIEEAPADVHNNMSVDLCVEGYLDVSIAEFGKALRETPNTPLSLIHI